MDQPISAIWLRRDGDHAEVCIEIEGHWRVIIRERLDAQFSHIAEALTWEKAQA